VVYFLCTCLVSFYIPPQGFQYRFYEKRSRVMLTIDQPVLIIVESLLDLAQFILHMRFQTVNPNVSVNLISVNPNVRPA